MKLLYFFLVVCGLACGCNKPIFDYRLKYVGEYTVRSINSHWVMGQPVYLDTTIYQLSVRRSENRYFIDFINQNNVTSYLMETDGTLHYDSGDPHYYVSGSFLDKNHFKLQGGYYFLGGGSTFNTDGTKQK